MPQPLRFRDLAEARERLSPAELRFERARRSIGLVLGPALFGLVLLLARDAEPVLARLGAILAWVLSWWISEAVPIPVTALLGPALGVLLGVGSAKELFASFGDPIIFLFLGSFILAEAMHGTGLDRRFAFAILARPSVGSSTVRMLVACGAITALLSMWLSNTATAAMLYPIATSLLGALSDLLARGGQAVDLGRLRYGTALMLTIAYAASIGGVGTPVGSPPNLVAIAQLEQLAGVRIPFFQWMLVAGPIVLVMLAVLVGYLLWALPPEVRHIAGGEEHAAAERAKLGRWTRAQRNVLFAFGVTVALWVLPGVLALVLGNDAELCRVVRGCVPEGVAAIVGAVLLFVLPVDWRERRFTLSWNDAVRVDWGTLLLFGGGLSLGEAMFRSGLARRAGTALLRLSGARSIWSLSYVFGLAAIVLTETTSNTAAATMVCPLAIAAARALGVSPVPPTLAATFGSSFAFLLPVSTPPNAIVYGSGCVPITAMLRHGGVLDLVGLALGPPAAVLMCRAVGLA